MISSKAAVQRNVWDYMFLVPLSASLRMLAGELSDFEFWEVEEQQKETAQQSDSGTRQAEYSIERVRRLSDLIWRCELQASQISSIPIRRPLLESLILCREALCQADVPAEMALLDGHPEMSIEICRSHVEEAFEVAGFELTRLVASCLAEAEILCPNGCASELAEEALGLELASANTNTMPVLQLAEMLQSVAPPHATSGFKSGTSSALRTTPALSVSERGFKVSLSFPGEYRKYVEAVADCLKDELGPDEVFYDSWFEAELARPNLDLLLQEIYHRRSDLVVVFLCQEYEKKEWCGLEWRAIRDLLKTGRAEAVMLLRFDEAEVSGVFSTDGYLSLRNRSPEEIAHLVIERLKANERSPNPLPAPHSSRRR